MHYTGYLLSVVLLSGWLWWQFDKHIHSW